MTGRASAKKQVHVKRIVEFAAIGAKKAKKKCRVREARLGHEADKNAKIKISGAKWNFTGRVSAKNKVHANRLVGIAATGAKKAKKSAACAKRG